jgi:predicted metal-dependent phosphoesterase TrpH
MNEIDLHMHTTCSDGTMTPRQIIAHAKAKGMKVISVTDHDTISHISDILREAEGSGIEVIPGTEVSAEYDSRGTMHILGYYIDPTNDEIYIMLQQFRDGRDERNPKIIERLNELGVNIDYSDVLKEAAGQSVGRPHIARVMLNKGYVSSTKEAFDRYLAKGAPAYFDRVRFYPERIISVIHAAGGLAFLAHPKQLGIKKKDELEKLLIELMQYGLDGIEVYSSCHSAKDIAIYLELARKYDLLISGGSDFHGLLKDHIDMGCVGGDGQLDYAMVEKMKQRLKKQ